MGVEINFGITEPSPLNASPNISSKVSTGHGGAVIFALATEASFGGDFTKAAETLGKGAFTGPAAAASFAKCALELAAVQCK